MDGYAAVGAAIKRNGGFSVDGRSNERYNYSKNELFHKVASIKNKKIVLRKFRFTISEFFSISSEIVVNIAKNEKFTQKSEILLSEY